MTCGRTPSVLPFQLRHCEEAIGWLADEAISCFVQRSFRPSRGVGADSERRREVVRGRPGLRALRPVFSVDLNPHGHGMYLIRPAPTNERQRLCPRTAWPWAMDESTASGVV